MSGDVQPRKRKDKKKKKDDLGIEEPRGTAAALGDGDIFMHSHHDHGTGGHWCAKVIFFGLLAVLVTLVGLIILENRGLSELEANSVESRYSGVLEGWLEEGNDHHHDEHTLELKHHDNEGDEHDSALEHEDDDDESEELNHDDDDGQNQDEDEDNEQTQEEEDDAENQDDDDEQSQEDDDDDDEEEQNQDDEAEDYVQYQDDDDYDGDNEENQDSNEENEQEQDEAYKKDANFQEALDDDSEEQNLEMGEDEDDIDEKSYRRYYRNTDNQIKDDDDGEDDEDLESTKNDQSAENNDENEVGQQNYSKENEDNERYDNNDSHENDDDDDQHQLNDEEENDADEDDDDHEDHNDRNEDDEVELEHIEEEVFDEDASKEAHTRELEDSEEVSREASPEADKDEDEIELLEPDDSNELPEELPIPMPKGKPLIEVDDTPSTERPQDTLADEEEYERQQEALRKEKEEASQGKDGGNSIEDEWPGEPSDAYWREELDGAERDLRQGDWTSAVERAGAAVLRSSARARYIIAKALDLSAEAKRDNSLLSKAIAAYLELLKMNEKLTDKKLLQVTERALDRMKFRGNYLATEPMYRLLFRRFPNDANHRNNLTISFLMANRVDLAEEVLKETLKLWPNDRLALAHHGFILKTRHNKQEEAVDAFMKALEGDTGPANEPRYYYHLGDSLLLLGRFKEAEEVHKRGAKLGHFLSPFQRSLYNVERLKSQPWWDVEKTPYSRLARALEKSYKDILKEGRSAQALYEKEKEGLKEKGEWSQLDLFARGREVEGRCARAPVTCGIVRSETAASGCRRGQIKFSLMEAGTHVRPHVGPTNCRLRMHLGLSNTKDTYIRVNQEIRQWQTGKVLMFDDSFEHEVWHNGTGARLVLIVDVWHPDLTRAERTQLPAI